MTLTYENVLVLSILGVAVLLFVTEKLRSDVVALLVLLALALTNLLSADDALSGFSHSAVVTIIGVFVSSAGLYQTGVAHQMGGVLTRIAGHSEVRLTVTLMLAVAAISAIMNNVGATAVLLPVVVGLARQNNISLSTTLLTGMTLKIKTRSTVE